MEGLGAGEAEVGEAEDERFDFLSGGRGWKIVIEVVVEVTEGGDFNG